MIVVTRYRVAAAGTDAFSHDADAALAVLSVQPGFVVILENLPDSGRFRVTVPVGSYRRALSAYDVKVTAVPLLSRALDEPSAYVVVRRWPGGEPGAGSLGGS